MISTPTNTIAPVAPAKEFPTSTVTEKSATFLEASHYVGTHSPTESCAEKSDDLSKAPSHTELPFDEAASPTNFSDPDGQSISEMFYDPSQDMMTGGMTAAQHALMVAQAMTASQQETAEKKRRFIDSAKYKTKLCRNYVMGIPCPFAERCAFSHGDLDAFHLQCQLQPQTLAIPQEGAAVQADTTTVPTPALDQPLSADATEFDPSNVNVDVSTAIQQMPSTDDCCALALEGAEFDASTALGCEHPFVSPPSYTDFMAVAAHTFGGSETESDDFIQRNESAISTIPADAKRYRYDPYANSGIVVCEE